MAIAVEDREVEGLEAVGTSLPAVRAGPGIKKLLLVPVTYAAVFVLINGPDQDGLGQGGIYGALIGGSGLAAAILCMRSWREFLSILVGAAVGSLIGFTFNPPCSGYPGLFVGPLMGWLAMRPFHPRQINVDPEFDAKQGNTQNWRPYS